MIDQLSARHKKIAEKAGTPGDPKVTVVFDAGQNSAGNFAHVTDTGLAFVGSIPPSHVADLADTLARGETRRSTAAVNVQIAEITRDPWLARVLKCELTGSTPATHRLTVTIDESARDALEMEVFGKRILVTTHDGWPVADVVAAYRSQSDAEFSFRQLKDPHVVSFSPMHHWTEHTIRVHTFTCVLALQIVHLMRREAEHAGLHLSVRDLLDQLAGIQETVLIYPSTGGRPKARRMLTETTLTQDQLTTIFNLTRWALKGSQAIHSQSPKTTPDRQEHQSHT